MAFSLSFSDQYSTCTGLYWWHFLGFSRHVTRPQGTWASLHMEFISLHSLAYVICCKYLSSKQLVINYISVFWFLPSFNNNWLNKNTFTSVSVYYLTTSYNISCNLWSSPWIGTFIIQMDNKITSTLFSKYCIGPIQVYMFTHWLMAEKQQFQSFFNGWKKRIKELEVSLKLRNIL